MSEATEEEATRKEAEEEAEEAEEEAEATRKEATKEEAMEKRAMAKQALAIKAYEKVENLKSIIISIKDYILKNSIKVPEEEQGYKLYDEQKYFEAANFFIDIIRMYKRKRNLNTVLVGYAEKSIIAGNEYYSEENFQGAADMYIIAIRFYEGALDISIAQEINNFIVEGNRAKNSGDRHFEAKEYSEASISYKNAIECYTKASKSYKTDIAYYHTSSNPVMKYHTSSNPVMIEYVMKKPSVVPLIEGGYKKRKSNHNRNHKRTRIRKHKHKWSLKYKRSINCKHPKGFSQRQHCKYGRKTMRKFRSKK